MSTANWELQLEKMKLLKLAMRTLYFSFLCFLIFCSLESTVSSETEILKQGEVVNSSSSLVSSNKTFTLGFLIPDERNNYSYLAIWYTNNSMIRYPVWIGNRNEPIHNNSGVLTIDSSGRLIIKHNRGNVVLSAEQTTLDTTATLQESGSFVLSEVSSNGSLIRELWNSFDYPTDTLLPGMKLGIKHKTGKNWSLTSWQNPITPAPGAFTLEWDPLRRRLVIRRRGVIYWTSGGLEKGEFPHIMTEFLNRNYKFSTLRSADEEYFSYSLIYDELTSIERRTISGWQLGSSGVIFDGDRPSFADAANCYGYEDEAQQSKGCELWKQPKCRKPGQIFELRSGDFMFTVGLRYAEGTIVGNSSFSLSDCRAECWNDCNCVGYDSYVSSTGCIFWIGKHLNFSQDISGMASRYYVITEVTEPQMNAEAKKREKKELWIIAPIVIPVFIMLLGLILCLKKWKQANARKEQEIRELLTDIYDIRDDESGGTAVKVYNYSIILTATKNFSSECELGKGGFGCVYKGTMPGGQEIAIKLLSEWSKQGLPEFKNELILIARLQHTNLVKLVGFCVHGDQKMLIYEYMPNKSLDFFLFNPNKRRLLSWESRFCIIEGIAQGLLYLHKYSRLRIVHRDLKASNILLDENMNPKISDFGMAKILKQNVPEDNTTRFAGTFGYMAPEYAKEGIFSTKSDVYSFGVLVLEIASGRKNNCFHNEEGPLNLVEYAWELWNTEAIAELIDPTLSDSCLAKEQVERAIHVGLLCVEECAADRPNMADVLSILNNTNIDLPKPKRPAFVSRFSVLNESQKDQTGRYSENGLSITTVQGR